MNSQYVNRIIRACKLDVSLYEEVEADKSATFQAAGVVVLSSLAAGVGALSLGASNFLMAPLLSLASWYVWAYLIKRFFMFSFICSRLVFLSIFSKKISCLPSLFFLSR